jgi:hypothetical protein
MFLNNAFQDLRRGGVIPRAFGIDHRDRALLADAQAIGLRAINAVLALRDPQFFEPAFEVLPGGDGFFLRRALRLGLIGAEENMAAGLGNRVFLCHFGEMFVQSS